MTNIILLAACLLAGLALRWAGKVPENAHVALNAVIIHLSLPALILAQVHGLHVTPGLLLAASMPWALFALSVLVFAGLGRLMRLTAGMTGALIMTAGLANTSFVGLPMIEAFYGADQMPVGIVIDQLGTYLVLSTLGVAVACVCSSGTASRGEVVRRIVTFPPLAALLLAVALAPLDYPAWLSGMLHRLGDTVAPLALVSVGLQLRLDQLAGNRLPLGLGLGFKLVLGPLLIAALYCGALSWSGDAARVTVFEAAMGPQIGGAVVAMQHGLSPALVTLMVGIGITLSFATLPLWHLGLALV